MRNVLYIYHNYLLIYLFLQFRSFIIRQNRGDSYPNRIENPILYRGTEFSTLEHSQLGLLLEYRYESCNFVNCHGHASNHEW